jgi:hypothetical protein
MALGVGGEKVRAMTLDSYNLDGVSLIKVRRAVCLWVAYPSWLHGQLRGMLPAGVFPQLD